MSRLGLFVVPSLAGACSDYDLTNENGPPNGAVPNIVVDPGALVFGELATVEREIKSFYVTNDGDAALTVSGMATVSGAGAFKVLATVPSFVLDIDEMMKVDVQYSPLSVLDFGQIVVYSDDPDSPEVPVDLSGQGMVPQLDITPIFHDFGDMAVPCGGMVQIDLNSVGREDLIITEINYESAGLLSLDATMLESLLPMTLSPGGVARVWVTAAAASPVADTGTLEVTSNRRRGDRDRQSGQAAGTVGSLQAAAPRAGPVEGTDPHRRRLRRSVTGFDEGRI